MRANMTQRDERIDLRVSADFKTLLSRGSGLLGHVPVELSHFCPSDHAKQVMGEHETVTL